jgi:hypothetical protein
LVKHPTAHPTDLLMKPQVNMTMLSLQGCVEAKSQGTILPYSEHTFVLGKSKLTDKKVSWRDTLFPHQDSYLLIAWGLLTESSKRICPESCFFYH